MKPRASQIRVDPTGLTTVTSTDLQEAIEELDAGIGGAGYTDEQVRDVIGAALVEGAGIDITVNDGADTITIATTGGGGGGATNHALYKTYTLSTAPHGSYPDLSATRYYDGSAWSARGKLTDGLTGWGYTQGQYVGWTGAVTPVVRIDLGSAKSVDRAVVHGTYGTGGVYRPNQIKLEWSDDDVNWTQVFDYSGIGDTSQPGDQPWWSDSPFTAASHRYWRVTFGITNGGTGGFLFVGEIALWGS